MVVLFVFYFFQLLHIKETAEVEKSTFIIPVFFLAFSMAHENDEEIESQNVCTVTSAFLASIFNIGDI